MLYEYVIEYRRLYCFHIPNTARHFLKVNMSGVHTEYFLLSEMDTVKKSAMAKRKDKLSPPPGWSGLQSVTLSFHPYQ